MKKQISLSPPTVGASSLLVIFAVLCLTVFALLSVSSVQADTRLGNSARDAIFGYYEADKQAEIILSRLRNGEIPPNVTETDGIYTYSCPLSDTQALEVQVSLQGAEYTILRWQVVSTADWQPDETLPVWNDKSKGE